MQSRQHNTYDDFGLPWEYDPDLGPMLASVPKIGEHRDVGHGKFVYRRADDGTVTVEATTTPGLAEQMQLERIAALDAIREKTTAFVAAWTSMRQLREARSSSPCFEGGNDDDKSEYSESAQEQAEKQKKQEVKAAAKRKKRAEDGGHLQKVSRKAGPVSKREFTGTGPENVTWDPNASDAELLKLCTITSTPRASTGRPDLKVLTPDGKSHRSRPEALRYMRHV